MVGVVGSVGTVAWVGSVDTVGAVVGSVTPMVGMTGSVGDVVLNCLLTWAITTHARITTIASKAHRTIRAVFFAFFITMASFFKIMELLYNFFGKKASGNKKGQFCEL
jgi:hypothetical protein